MIVIGITGSIGCGKTTIAKIISDLGYYVFNADEQVKNIYKEKEFIDLIKINFPETFIDEKFNKKILREIIFNDFSKKEKLEKIIHPLLKEKLKQKIRKNCKFNNFLFIDAALLYEVGWNIYCDYIIVADVDYEIQKKRVIKRDNISAEEFEKINETQINNKNKIKMSDFVVNTDKSFNMLKSELIKIIKIMEA